MNRLENKVALITGAGRGIGKSAALLFAHHGANVVVVDIDSSGEETVDEIHAGGGKALYVNAHVANEPDCENAMLTAEKTFGKLDIVFNNAGIMHPKDGDIIDLDEKVWDMTMSVNAKGIYLCCKHAIPALLRSGGGSVINSASYVAITGSTASKVAYTASKGAVLALTRDLAAQYAHANIRANALCPGPIATENFLKYYSDEDSRTRYLNNIALKRFADPREIAKAILFLASDESSYITGSTFTIDGGLTSIITQ